MEHIGGHLQGFKSMSMIAPGSHQAVADKVTVTDLVHILFV